MKVVKELSADLIVVEDENGGQHLAKRTESGTYVIIHRDWEE